MKSIRILMVEDEPGVLASNQDYFTNLGYETIAAETIQKARFLLEECCPDLILLDITLPDGSGLSFCQEIRRKTKAPILFLTARTEDESQLAGLTMGACDYITKPYNLAILAAKVQLRLAEHRQTSLNILSMPPLVIDRVKNQVILNQEEIPLTPKEVKLLGCLAEREGQRVAGEELYQTIWGGAGEQGLNTIKVHISNLRKKLALDDQGFFEIRATKQKEYILIQTRFS